MLEKFLDAAIEAGQCSHAVSDGVRALAVASLQIAALSAQTGLAGSDHGAVAGGHNFDGDQQKALDVMADDVIAAALKAAGVGVYLSEEQDAPIILNAAKSDAKMGAIMVAADPLDGSSNIDTNLSVGTIFSVLPAPPNSNEDACLGDGRRQLAAGFFIYGPQTGLLLTLGHGTVYFVLDANGIYQQSDWQPAIPLAYPEFAINAANSRFWTAPMRQYSDALLAGSDGPLEQHYNMRWCGSLVADALRIFRRGGIFLYPEDARPGYAAGRLRLLYEAHPVAFLVEQAGGLATNGLQPILDVKATSLHARTPFIFGSHHEVVHYQSVAKTGILSTPKKQEQTC